MKRPRILIGAPGAGLGHLVRAVSLSLALKQLGLSVRILTYSRFALWLARITGADLDFIPSAKWKILAGKHAAGLNPDLFVADTFPWGLRGEWRFLEGKTEIVFLARRLNVPTYETAAGLSWNPHSPLVQKVVAAEPLNIDLRRKLEQDRAEIQTLESRIRFPFEQETAPLPGALEETLASGKCRLVVHSGPDSEVTALARLARQTSPDPDPEIVVVRPQPALGGWSYFPAARLFERAQAIVTGAGYNSMAETDAWPQKHFFIPFPRRYDDQLGRSQAQRMSPGDGARQAAEVIAAWL